MQVPADTTARAQAFIQRWQAITASELSTAQSFFIGLCSLLEVEPPHPTPERGSMFERPLMLVHDELDAAELQAYGCSNLGSMPCADEAIRATRTKTLLEHLVALNAQRAAEETAGTVRWLRPAFQDPARRSNCSPLSRRHADRTADPTATTAIRGRRAASGTRKSRRG